MNASSRLSQVLDIAHLARQTFDDRELEREVLALFEEQCARLVPIMAGNGPAVERANAAHTLKGAALAIGAGQVAALSQTFEAASPEGQGKLVPQFEAAVRDVLSAIASRGRAAA